MSEKLKPYGPYILMFLLNLAVLTGVIYLLRRETPRPVSIRVTPSLAATPTLPISAPAQPTIPLSPPSKTAPSSDVVRSTPPSAVKVNLNSASLEELAALPRIGQVLAERIVEYRNSKKFETIEEIKNIRGIGDTIFEEIKDLITVQ